MRINLLSAIPPALIQLIYEFYKVFLRFSTPMSNYCAANDTKSLKAELQCTKLLETGSISENCINSKSELSDRLKLYLWNETGKITKVLYS